MFVLCLGVSVGVCEFVIDYWKGEVESFRKEQIGFYRYKVVK